MNLSSFIFLCAPFRYDISHRYQARQVERHIPFSHKSHPFDCEKGKVVRNNNSIFFFNSFHFHFESFRSLFVIRPTPPWNEMEKVVCVHNVWSADAASSRQRTTTVVKFVKLLKSQSTALLSICRRHNSYHSILDRFFYWHDPWKQNNDQRSLASADCWAMKKKVEI